MSDISNVPPPLPGPQLPPEPQTLEPSPWNFPLTLLFGLSIMVVWIIIQTVTTLSFFLFSVDDPIAALENLNEEVLMKFAADGDVLGLVSVISGALTILLIIAVIRLSRFPVSRYLALKAPNPLWIIVGIVVTLGLNMGLGYLSPLFEEPEVNEFMESTYTSVDNLVMIWLGVAFMAPLFEEIFFRGFLYTGWKNSPIGGFGAAILTSGIWAVIHLQYPSTLLISWIFVFGLVLCLAREITGSIWVPIIMHVFNNAWATYWTGSAIAEGL